MHTLALDCSTARGSLALAGTATGTILFRAEFTAGRGHGGALFTSLERAVHVTRSTGQPLTEIIVGLGPGSYSGVRQAIAAATGLAFATGARLHGRPSTAALQTDHHRYQALGDARRGAFYYTAVADGRCVVGPELLSDLPALQSRLAERPDWPVLAVENLPAGVLPEIPVVLPEADRLLLGPVGDLVPAPLEPIYLRPVTITLPAGKKPSAAHHSGS